MIRLATVLSVVVVLLYAFCALPWVLCCCIVECPHGMSHSIKAAMIDCPETPGHDHAGLTDSLNLVWALPGFDTAPPLPIVTLESLPPDLLLPTVDSDLRSPPPKPLTT